MAALNYFIGVKRGAPMNLDQVISGTGTAGTAVDVEVNIQINNGSNTTGITILDTIKCLEIIQAFIIQRGIVGPTTTGVDIPAN